MKWNAVMQAKFTAPVILGTAEGGARQKMQNNLACEKWNGSICHLVDCCMTKKSANQETATSLLSSHLWTQQLWWSIRWAVPQCQISNSGLEACMCVQHCALALCKHPSQVPGTGVVNYITSRRKGILKKAGRISWEVYTFICIFQSNVS